MSGGRLTYAEREQIAAGQAKGLSNAEIARRLGRPPSTVSREVQRRRTAATDATDATGAVLPASGDDSARDPEEVRKYQDWLTAVLVEMGLSRMNARVLTCLAVTDSGSLTAAELVQRLRVSPASISKAVSSLEEQGLVGRERSERRERYVFDDDAWLRAWMVSARANETLSGAALRGADILGQTTPAGARMAQMANFLRLVGEDMIRSAEHWWPIVTARP
jgi:predicted transcriptional regulator